MMLPCRPKVAEGRYRSLPTEISKPRALSSVCSLLTNALPPEATKLSAETELAWMLVASWPKPSFLAEELEAGQRKLAAEPAAIAERKKNR